MLDAAAFGQSGTDLYFPANGKAPAPDAELWIGPPGAEGAADVPKWISEVLPTLRQLLALPDNWNSYGAQSPKASNITAAIELMASLMRPGTPVPLLMPTADGSLQLEWHEGGIDLEVRVRGRNRYYVSFSDLQNSTNDWEGAVTSNLFKLKAAIDELTGRSH